MNKAELKAQMERNKKYENNLFRKNASLIVKFILLDTL